MVSFTPRPLYPQEKCPRYPWDRKLGRHKAGLDMVSKRKIPSPRRESRPYHPIVQPVANDLGNGKWIRFGTWTVGSLCSSGSSEMAKYELDLVATYEVRLG
jgi:hypothetical protein